MKFCLVNGERLEAKPNLTGLCPACGQAMIAKCGEIKASHWAHKGRRNCDVWWENETEWHRTWKEQFPENWQEVVHKASNGEKHIADIKTDADWVIEFQNSYIEPDERQSRNDFYTKLVWVVNGFRRKSDQVKFNRVLNESSAICSIQWPRRVDIEECRLLLEWSGSPALVFFDFGKDGLWWFHSKSTNGPAYVTRFTRTEFIQIYRDSQSQSALKFEEFLTNAHRLIAEYESRSVPRAQTLQMFQLPLVKRTRQRRF